MSGPSSKMELQRVMCLLVPACACRAPDRLPGTQMLSQYLRAFTPDVRAAGAAAQVLFT
jgi:hypothetical protein